MINQINIDLAIEKHKERPPPSCRCCGKSSLHDGVKLVRTNPHGEVGKWQCLAPCEKNRKKKQISVKKSNNRVMIREVWCNSLLERLSGQLSTRTVSFEPKGEQSKLPCPAHYAFDLMIPLAHAGKQEPLGWIIFGAKYVHDEEMLEALRTHVAAELPEHQYTVSLVDLVVDNFCYGLIISGRSLRRTLDLSRGAQSAYHAAMEGILSNLHAVEENYAREVKRFL
jgi:hypothetical protein